MREQEEHHCRFGIHQLKREFVGDDSREFRVHFYKCIRCSFRGVACPVQQPLSPPPLMTRLFGGVED